MKTILPMHILMQWSNHAAMPHKYSLWATFSLILHTQHLQSYWLSSIYALIAKYVKELLLNYLINNFIYFSSDPSLTISIIPCLYSFHLFKFLILDWFFASFRYSFSQTSCFLVCNSVYFYTFAFSWSYYSFFVYAYVIL